MEETVTQKPEQEAEQQTVKQPEAEQPKIEQPKIEQPKTEQPKVEPAKPQAEPVITEAALERLLEEEAKPQAEPEEEKAEEDKDFPAGAAKRIVISETADGKCAAGRVCEVCGHVNKGKSLLCEMCSNYLFD